MQVAFFFLVFLINWDMEERREKRKRERGREGWIIACSRHSDFLLLWERKKKGLDRSWVDCGERGSSFGEREGEEAAERPSRDLLLLGVGRGESQSSTRQETRQTRRGGEESSKARLLGVLAGGWDRRGWTQGRKSPDWMGAEDALVLGGGFGAGPAIGGAGWS